MGDQSGLCGGFDVFTWVVIRGRPEGQGQRRRYEDGSRDWSDAL